MIKIGSKSLQVSFVCFSTNNLKAARDQIVADAKKLEIFDRIEVWDEVRLANQPEYKNLPERLKSGRGHGFFWWKPFIIRKALEETQSGDLVFYSDCGRYDGGFRLGRGTEFLIKRFKNTGFAGVEVPQFGGTKLWTRSECFNALCCDPAVVGKLPQIQATFSLWVADAKTLSVVREWESHCRNPALVADPVGDELVNQSSEFIDHRHDQSLLTLLVRKNQICYIKLANFFESWILRNLRRLEVVNVEMKKVDFVANCLRSNKILLLLLFMRYAKNLLIKINFKY